MKGLSGVQLTEEEMCFLSMSTSLQVIICLEEKFLDQRLKAETRGMLMKEASKMASDSFTEYVLARK